MHQKPKFQSPKCPSPPFPMFPLLNLALRLPLLHLHFLLREIQTHTINTMPLIRRRLIPLPLKHMTQMPATIRTDYLRPRRAHRPIRAPLYGSRDAVEVRGPSAARCELVRGCVERRGTARAGVGPGFGGVGVVFAGSGGLGAFLTEDAELF
jgi:hypothetical protein